MGLIKISATIMAAITLAGANAASLPPIGDFFNNPELSSAQLSPSGRFLAAKAAAPNGRERLIVLDLNNNKASSVAHFDNVDIGNVQWVSDQRLIFDTDDKQLGQGEIMHAPGLYAVNRDGSSMRQLAYRDASSVTTASMIDRNILPWHTFMLDHAGAQSSESVYVRSANPWISDRSVNLLRLNTLNGQAVTIQRPADTERWVLNHKGEPGIATSYRDGQSAIMYLDPGSKTWRKLASYHYLDDDASIPVAFGPDGTLYVIARRDRDKRALYTMDLETGKLSDEPLLTMADYDFNGSLVISNGKLAGIRYTSDATNTAWLDPEMKAVQAEIDAKLSGTINVVNPPVRPETPYLLVVAYSDIQPRAYFLYDRDKKVLNPVGYTHPKIKPEHMGRQQIVRYQAQDGLSIPALVTLPRNASKNLPMVVLVHGGPYVRGTYWGWDAESQFLASRGYAVLEPEYRGSTGYGFQHFRAGWKQWGLKMQDDIADGVKWAIRQGIADPKRICIAGASYGGYATLMGLLNNPELYQCGINWLGVTDIKLMYTGHWTFNSDIGEDSKKYGMPLLVGDLEKDAAQLKATSPLEQAARIKQPLMLAYGRADTRVPFYHGTKFRDAVNAHNPQVEWIQYNEEGHGWALPKNRIDFWGRIEQFLDKHIGAAAKKE